MHPRQIENLLHEVRDERRGGAPHEDWVGRNRGILLMQVRNTTDAAKAPGLGDMTRHLFGIFVPAETVMVAARALGAFVLVVGTVLAGGLASAQVYRDAMPGEVFYDLKVAVERAQLALAPNEEYRTNLHTDFADRRIDEISRLAESSPDRQAFLPEALSAFEREVRALESGLEKLKVKDPEGVAEMAKLMERKMAVYQNLLRKAAAAAPAARASIAATRGLVDDAAITAMAIIVEKHLQGDTHAPATVLVSKFEERLRVAERSLEPAEGEDAPRTTKAKAAIAEAKALIKEENYQAALVKIAEVAELTLDDEASPAEGEGNDDEAVTPEEGETPAPVDASDGAEDPAPEGGAQGTP